MIADISYLETGLSDDFSEALNSVPQDQNQDQPIDENLINALNTLAYPEYSLKKMAAKAIVSNDINTKKSKEEREKADPLQFHKEEESAMFNDTLDSVYEHSRQEEPHGGNISHDMQEVRDTEEYLNPSEVENQIADGKEDVTPIIGKLTDNSYGTIFGSLKDDSIMYAGAMDSYLRSIIDCEDRLRSFIQSECGVSSNKSSKVQPINEEARIQDTVRERWQKLIDFNNQIDNRFFDSMNKLVVSERQYLEKYEEIIKDKKPKENITYEYTGDYAEAQDRCMNTPIPVFNYEKDAEWLRQDGYEGALKDFMAGKGFTYDKEKDLPQQFKSWFLAAERGTSKGNLSNMNMDRLYNFCYNYGDIENVVKKDQQLLNQSMNQLLNAVDKTLRDRGESTNQNTVANSQQNTTPDTATKESTVWLEADQNNDAVENTSKGSTGLKLDTNTGDKKDENGNTTNTTDKAAGEGSTAYQDIRNIQTKWINLSKAMLTAKKTVIQQIARDYMKMIKAHVRSYSADAEKVDKSMEKTAQAQVEEKNEDNATQEAFEFINDEIESCRVQLDECFQEINTYLANSEVYSYIENGNLLDEADESKAAEIKKRIIEAVKELLRKAKALFIKMKTAIKIKVREIVLQNKSFVEKYKEIVYDGVSDGSLPRIITLEDAYNINADSEYRVCHDNHRFVNPYVDTIIFDNDRTKYIGYAITNKQNVSMTMDEAEGYLRKEYGIDKKVQNINIDLYTAIFYLDNCIKDDFNWADIYLNDTIKWLDEKFKEKDAGILYEVKESDATACYNTYISAFKLYHKITCEAINIHMRQCKAAIIKAVQQAKHPFRKDESFEFIDNDEILLEEIAEVGYSNYYNEEEDILGFGSYGFEESVIDDVKTAVKDTLDKHNKTKSLKEEWKRYLESFSSKLTIKRYIKDDRQKQMLMKYYNMITKEDANYAEYKRAFNFFCNFMGLPKNGIIIENIKFVKDSKEKDQDIIALRYSKGIAKVKIPEGFNLIHASPAKDISALNPTFRSKVKGKYMYPTKRVYFTIMKDIKANKAGIHTQVYKYTPKGKFTYAYIDPACTDFSMRAVFINTDKPIPVENFEKKMFRLFGYAKESNEKKEKDAKRTQYDQDNKLIGGGNK